MVFGRKLPWQDVGSVGPWSGNVTQRTKLSELSAGRTSMVQPNWLRSEDETSGLF